MVGLAPTRTGLKGRVLGLLCIHGRKENRPDNTIVRTVVIVGGASSPSAQRHRPRVFYVNTGRSVAITWINPAFTNASMTDSTGL